MFKYRLQTYLRYCKSLEEERNRSLAEASRNWMARKEMVNKTERGRMEAMYQLKIQLPNIENPAWLSLYHNYFAGASSDKMVHTQEVEAAFGIVEMERGKLIEAVKKRKTLEIHRDRLKKRYEEDEARRETVAADEMTMARYKRKESEYA